MTELEIMQRAKGYMDSLARGIDPITNTELPEDSALNHVRLSRCFFYVSGVLQQVIDNGGRVTRAKQPYRADFFLPEEARRKVPYSEHPVLISEFIRQLNTLIDTDTMRELSATAVTGWLLSCGLMQKEVDSRGKSHRCPTQSGREIGLTTEMRQGPNGEYLAVLYSEEAQRFLIDNLDAILDSRKKAQRAAGGGEKT